MDAGKMAKTFFAVIGLIGLIGLMACAHEVRHEPVEVKVPVAVQCPEPPAIEKPALPYGYVHYLSPADENGIGCVDESSFKNLLELIMRQNLYIKKLEESLKAYTRQN